MSVLSASAIKGRFLKGIDPSSSTDDVAIEAVVDAADLLISQAIGLPENTSGSRTLAATSYDLYLIPPKRYRRRLWLPVIGSGTVDSVSVEIGDDSETVDSDDYELRNGRMLYHKVGKWVSSDDPVLRVQLSSWGLSLDVDHPLGVAVGMLTAHLWNAPKTQGRSNLSQNGKSIGVADGDRAIPPQISAMISGFAVSAF